MFFIQSAIPVMLQFKVQTYSHSDFCALHLQEVLRPTISKGDFTFMILSQITGVRLSKLVYIFLLQQKSDIGDTGCVYMCN